MQGNETPMIEPISRGPSLADSVAERIRQDITSGTYGVGDRLPTERVLSEKYDVSRPIIREALGTLKRDGLISTRQGLGAFVIETREMTFRFRGLELNDANDIRNVIELLMAIEAAATAYAAERRSREQLVAIETQMRAMETAVARGESGVEEDIAFHCAIVDACGNPYFQDMSKFLDDRVRNFIRKARASTTRQSLIERVKAEHLAIFEAIAAGNAQEARLAAEAHLRAAASRLALHLSDATLRQAQQAADLKTYDGEQSKSPRRAKK